MFSLIDSLVDEIWMSILHDWMGNSQRTLVALDMAVLNHVTRTKYLSWFHKSKCVLANIEFRLWLNDKWMDWCKTRNIYPTKIFSAYEHLLKTPNMSNVKMATLITDVSYVEIFDRLATFPAVKEMKIVHVNEKNPQRGLEKYHKAVNLTKLQLSNVRFSGSIEEFEMLEINCPMLESISFFRCPGVNLIHIVYLMNRLEKLTSLEYSRVQNHSSDTDNDLVEITRNTRLTTLDLSYPFHLDSCVSYMKILSHCPLVQTLTISPLRLSEPELNTFLDIISTCWTHLEELLLLCCQLYNEEILATIGRYCAHTLKKLHISVSGAVDEDFDNACIQTICASFPHLIEFSIYDKYASHALVAEEFLDAVFLPTLQSLHLQHPIVTTHLHTLLASCPVLTSLELIVGNTISEGSGMEWLLYPGAERLEHFEIRATSTIQGKFMIGHMKNLHSLVVGSFPLRPEELRLILSLPKLTTLKIGNTFSVKEVTLFQASSYPSAIPSELAPLQALDLEESDIRFTEQKIWMLLTRFPSLKSVQFGEVTTSNPAFDRICAAFKYQLETFTFESKAKYRKNKEVNFQGNTIIVPPGCAMN